MANNLQRVVVLATVVSAIILAGTCQEEGEKNPPVGGDTPVLPDIPMEPGESGALDVNNNSVTEGVMGIISPIFWPATGSFLHILNFILRVFVGEKLPCTIWSVTPARIACTPLEGPVAQN